MGYAAAHNPRSRQGVDPATGRMKTKAYCALHRLWRMVDYFQGDRMQMALWLDKMKADDITRAAVDKLWAKRYPKPRVTLETQMPKAELRIVR